MNFGFEFEILEIVAQTSTGDLTSGFLQSKTGSDIFSALNIGENDIQVFLNSRRDKVYPSMLNLKSW